MSIYVQSTFFVRLLFGCIIRDDLITEFLFLFLEVFPSLVFQGK